MTEPTDNQLDSTPPARKRRPRQPEQLDAMLTSRPWERCGVSRSAWFALAAAGKTPAGVRLPGKTRQLWRTADLAAWVASLPTTGTRRRKSTPAA